MTATDAPAPALTDRFEPCSDAPLAALPDPIRERLWMRGCIQPMRSGETVHVQGSGSTDVFFVLSGIVKVSVVSSTGADMLLALRSPGELVGHFAAIDGHGQPASAQAMTDAELLRLKAGDFLDLLATHPTLARAIMAGLARQVRDLASHVLEVTDVEASALVARRLMTLATDRRYRGLRRTDDQRCVIAPALSQADLAGWAGVCHRSAAAALQSFRRDGLIRTRRLCIEVLDLDGLERRAAAV